jgi:hypothetical protein
MLLDVMPACEAKENLIRKKVKLTEIYMALKAWTQLAVNWDKAMLLLSRETV